MLSSVVLVCGSACSGDGTNGDDSEGAGAGASIGSSATGGPSGSKAGESGSSAGSGDRPGSKDGGAQGGAGSSGTTGTAAGAGSDDDGGAHADSDAGSPMPTLDDVDLTLAGLNDDLPQPSRDCPMLELHLAGCISITGEYNGEAFALDCNDGDIKVAFDGSHIVGCQGDVAGGTLIVDLHLDASFVEAPPVSFSVKEPEERTYVSVWHLERDFASNPKDAFVLAATHTQELAIAGLTDVYEFPSSSPAVPPRTRWRTRGTFALSLIPDACTPDDMGFGCDEVRLRSSFAFLPYME